MIRLLALFSVVALGVGAYISYYSARQQALLTHELQQLTNTLTLENDQADRRAYYLLKELEDEVAKNRNEPLDMRVLHRAQQLATQASVLRDTLRAIRNHLRYSDQARPVVQVLGAGTRQHQTLQLQLTSYAASLHQVGIADTSGLKAPVFDQLPLAEACVALAELESIVLDYDARLIQHLGSQLPSTKFQNSQLAVATAESAVVAPGSLYRAHLRPVRYLTIPQVTMYCNNRRITTSTMGIGQVRFRAPLKPGPAVWIATIHMGTNERDSTFVVRVPYRVARR